MYLNINPDNPQRRLLEPVVEAMRQGAVICYPTDTVYGIGCDIYNQKAVKRIFQIKRRAADKPFSFMCADLKDVSTYCHISNLAYRIMRKCLPGPYTFVLPAMKIVPKIMMTRQKTVGIRVPDNAICRELVALLGNPVVTTSALLPGEEDFVSEPYMVEEKFAKLVDVIIDGGSVFPTPSTVVSLVGEEPEVLRPGKGVFPPLP
ncbi:MAG: L-threonylcarbamoyladenylate synthase [Thermodesulfobacteriota bacterium]